MKQTVTRGTTSTSKGPSAGQIEKAKAVSTPPKQPVNEEEIRIIVIGRSGALGKSSFTNLANNSTLRVGSSLGSCTESVELPEPFELQGPRICLIDTPGFDDSSKSDAEVFNTIANFLANEYMNGRKLSGLIYFHRISDVRMGAILKRNGSHWCHLRRTNVTPPKFGGVPLEEKIVIEFFRLREGEFGDDGGIREIVPDGANLNVPGAAGIDLVVDEASYGFKIIDHSPLDLYPYSLFFDNSDLSISSLYQASSAREHTADPRAMKIAKVSPPRLWDVITIPFIQRRHAKPVAKLHEVASPPAADDASDIRRDIELLKVQHQEDMRKLKSDLETLRKNRSTSDYGAGTNFPATTISFANTKNVNMAGDNRGIINQQDYRRAFPSESPLYDEYSQRGYDYLGQDYRPPYPHAPVPAGIPLYGLEEPQYYGHPPHHWQPPYGYSPRGFHGNPLAASAPPTIASSTASPPMKSNNPFRSGAFTSRS